MCGLWINLWIVFCLLLICFLVSTLMQLMSSENNSTALYTVKQTMIRQCSVVQCAAVAKHVVIVLSGTCMNGTLNKLTL